MNETIGDRIKKMRKEMGLTQKAFAEKLGMKQNTIAQIETGKSAGSQTVKLICQEFHINEEWLRTGEGDQFVLESDNPLDAIVKKHHLSETGRFIIEKYLQFNESMRGIFDAELKKIFDEWQTSASKASKEDPQSAQESEIATLKHQVQELKSENEGLKRKVLEFENLDARITALEQEAELEDAETVNQTISGDTHSL